MPFAEPAEPSARVFAIQGSVDPAIRRLLSAQDRDPYSATFGCFDRRYWAWKLVDMPEATFQRNTQALAAVLVDPRSRYYQDEAVRESLAAAIRYTRAIQRQDGSFDQAFPFERSVGATAFLVQAMLDVAETAGGLLEPPTLDALRAIIAAGARFLYTRDEEHAFIANHQVAIAASLIGAAAHCDQPRYARRAAERLDELFRRQSAEGWFPEYDGADPGYQSLTLYYLALLQRRDPSLVPPSVVSRSVEFLSYFVHPDGTFGGDYGSRRTALYYPGGVAFFAGRFPMAAAISAFMAQAIAEGRTTALADVDAGNVAPLLANYILAAAFAGTAVAAGGTLPWESRRSKDMPDAGLFVRASGRYYAIVGASNGGVLKIFDTATRAAVLDDGGYIGELRGILVSTQVTGAGTTRAGDDGDIEVCTECCDVVRTVPAPVTWLALRVAALTVLRVRRLAELFKQRLVAVLIRRVRRRGVHVVRRVKFEPQQIVIRDVVTKSSRHDVTWLKTGGRFTSIHMASAKYFEGARRAPAEYASAADVATLNRTGSIIVERVVRL